MTRRVALACAAGVVLAVLATWWLTDALRLTGGVM